MSGTNELCVLITGAGDSVGRVTAEKFLGAGAQVHICDVREDAVQATLAANPDMGGSVCNVGSKAVGCYSITMLYVTIRKWL